MIPSNTLAAMYGIAADCAERRVLGPEVDIDIAAIDETNTYINVPALIDRLREHGNFGLIALVIAFIVFPRYLKKPIERWLFQDADAKS